LFNILPNNKTIHVDNPPLAGLPSAVSAAQESRNLSHKKLILYLGTCQDIYKPANLTTLQQRINDYQTKTEQLQKELQKMKEERDSKNSATAVFGFGVESNGFIYI